MRISSIIVLQAHQFKQNDNSYQLKGDVLTWMIGDRRLKGELIMYGPWDKKQRSVKRASLFIHSWVIGLLPQQCVLTVVCWMWHRGVVLQMAVGVVGYVGGEAVVPRPG